MSFNRAKHVKYWRLCANILPDHYTSADGSRMFLAFFIVAALDVLGVLHDPDHGTGRETVTPTERKAWIDWIYSLQVPDSGGFRGFTGTDLGDVRNEQNRHWDPGNLPNTFFALAALTVLRDDLGRVNTNGITAWLPRLQRADGSFGEILGPESEIEGGRDLRYCCCAAGIAFLLRLPEGTFDENKLVEYIMNCQSYEGGFGESPLREPHSGLNYCAVATLELLARRTGRTSRRASEALEFCRESDLRWILERETDVLEDADEDDEDDIGSEHDTSTKERTDNGNDHPQIFGFNGRANKTADTCYCFWNAGALSMFDALHLADGTAISRYLLEQTQHLVGGFGKAPGAPPDIMHAYLGLVTLSLFDEGSKMYSLKPIDPGLCISKEAVTRLR